MIVRIKVPLMLATYEDLFERLRELRGNKTMVFSSHRFGNLTRHADLILCVVLSHRSLAPHVVPT